MHFFKTLLYSLMADRRLSSAPNARCVTGSLYSSTTLIFEVDITSPVSNLQILAHSVPSNSRPAASAMARWKAPRIVSSKGFRVEESFCFCVKTSIVHE